jgi:azurin
MVHCITGRIVGEAVVLAKPKPMQVLTTDGMAMTGVEEKVKKKKVKK